MQWLIDPERAPRPPSSPRACRPSRSFTLLADERPVPVEEVLEQFDALADANDHFEFFWFPYGRKALVKRNNRVSAADAAAAVRPLPRWPRFWEFEVMEKRRLRCAVPGRPGPAAGHPRAEQVLFGRAVLQVLRRPVPRVFVTPHRVRFAESESTVPRESLGHVIAELRRAVPSLAEPVMFPVEVREAAADDIWLSTAYGRVSAYIAIHQYAGLPYQAYFDRFEAIVAEVAGRPHWGKVHSLNAGRLRSPYPRYDEFRRVRAEVDPEARFGNSYLTRVLGDARDL